MKRTALACLIALASSSAFAQQPPRSYSLSVTTDEANIILNKLGEMPWKDANPIMSKLIGQLNEQNKPAPLAVPSAPPALKD